MVEGVTPLNMEGHYGNNVRGLSVGPRQRGSIKGQNRVGNLYWIGGPIQVVGWYVLHRGTKRDDVG